MPSCAEITHCLNCTGFGCIWCGQDSGCHAELSPYGCVNSVACPGLLQCMRKQPQHLKYKDYAHMNIVVCVITIIVASILISILWILLHYCIEYRRRRIMNEHHRKIDIELERYVKEPYKPLYGNQEEISNIIPFDRRNYSSISNSVASIQRLGEYRSPRESDIKKDKYVRCSCGFISCLSFLIIVLSFIIVLIFPTTPEYHICNSQTDWGEIWSSLIHGSAQTNYDILITVKNNNYFSVELTDISTRFYYDKKLMIAYWYPCNPDTYHVQNQDYCNIYIPAHSIVDILADVTFIPPISEAYTIYSLYEENNLKLEIDFIANTRTYFLNKKKDIKLFDMHLNLDKNNFLVGATMPTDRTDCKCKKDT